MLVLVNVSHSGSAHLPWRRSPRCTPLASPFSMALLDLDYFKAINDKHGQAVGGTVLKGFCQIAHETIRATDIFARCGGEEFLMVLPETQRSQAVQAIGRSRQRLALENWANVAEGLRVSASVGVTTMRQGLVAEVLLSEAGLALYEAKRHGRECLVVPRFWPQDGLRRPRRRQGVQLGRRPPCQGPPASAARAPPHRRRAAREAGVASPGRRFSPRI